MNISGKRRAQRSKLGLLFSSALVASTPALPAYAQGAGVDDDGATETEVLVVTATRRTEAIIEVPLAVSVIDTQQTIVSGITDINGIADLVPGLVAVDGGAPSLGNLVIRGTYVGGAPTVATYIDDVPYGGVVGGFAANQALDASLYDLQAIEVSRGPQGTLFGAGAVGGVVRYITKKPNLDELEGFAFADISGTKDGGTNQLYRGRVSVPVIDEKLAISASGYFEDAGGYIDSVVTGDENINTHDFWGGQLMVKMQVTDGFSLLATVMHHEADYDSAGYESFDFASGDPLFGELVTDFAAPRALNYDIYSLTADVELGFADLTSITSFQTAELVNTTDITATFGATADALAPGGAPHTVGFRSGDETDRFTQEVRLTSTGDGFIEWIVGGYYTNQESDSFQITDVVPNDIELITLNTTLEYEEFALFGNVTVNITDRWDVTGGIRYSDNSLTISQIFTGALSNPALNDLVNENDDDVVTWLFDTGYAVNDAINLYARIASGYRPGGSNLVIDFGGTLIGNPTFDSDNLWSYEAGLKGLIPGTDLRYDFGVFYIDWSDAQLATQNALGLGETANALGQITIQGIEAGLAGELFDGFIVTGSLAITDSEIEEDEPQLLALAGDELLQVPDVTFSLTGDYSWSLTSSIDANVGATLRYTGSFETAFSQSPLGTFTNDSYAQVDLRAGITYESVSVNAYVTNVGNSSAYQTVFGTGVPGQGYGVVLRPRTFGVNVGVQF
ncbi:MAG: TonB-dependent receptor [Pseudomonadota bacterium]